MGIGGEIGAVPGACSVKGEAQEHCGECRAKLQLTASLPTSKSEDVRKSFWSAAGDAWG